MAVVGITMVRNEEDVIDHVVRHMLNQGLDLVVVADNLSTDDTRAILDSITDERLIVLDDRVSAYYQSEKMTALAQTYAKPGDWVVPFDADELWGMPNGRLLSDGLRSLPGPVAAGRPWTHVPHPGDPVHPDCPFRSMPWRRREKEFWPKAALVWDDNITIEQGNHWTTSHVDDVLDIRHFQYRSYDHYVSKVEDGRRAMELTDLPYSSSEHWRRAAEMSGAERETWWKNHISQPLTLDPARCLA